MAGAWNSDPEQTFSVYYVLNNEHDHAPYEMSLSKSDYVVFKRDNAFAFNLFVNKFDIPIEQIHTLHKSIDQVDFDLVVFDSLIYRKKLCPTCQCLTLTPGRDVGLGTPKTPTAFYPPPVPMNTPRTINHVSYDLKIGEKLNRMTLEMRQSNQSVENTPTTINRVTSDPIINENMTKHDISDLRFNLSNHVTSKPEIDKKINNLSSETSKKSTVVKKIPKTTKSFEKIRKTSKSSGKTPKTPSDVLDHYSRTSRLCEFKCKHCPETYKSPKKLTTTLRRHLLLKHPFLYHPPTKNS